MSLPPDRADLISAALRHVRDAEHLVASGEHQSIDQAFHLAGYGPECARKSSLTFQHFDKLLGHLLTEAADEVVEVAMALDPIAHRYRSAWSQPHPALETWDEQSRYSRTGTYPVRAARALVEGARDTVDTIVLALWSDGRLETIP